MPVYRQSVFTRPPGSAWADVVAVNRADPALGPLQSLSLSLSGALLSGLVIENQDLAPAPFASTDSATVTLRRPDGSAWLAATPHTDISGVLLPGSRRVVADQVGTGQDVATYGTGPTPSADAALLVGTGAVRLPIDATARVHATGPGNVVASFSSDVAATVGTAFQIGLSPGGPPLGSVSGTTLIGNPSFILPIDARTTAAQQRTVALETTGWTHSLDFAGFDPALGTLLLVNLTVVTASAGRVSAENLDPVAADVAVRQTATVNVLRADGRVLDSGVSVRAADSALAAFDGQADFAGASGVSDAADRSATPASVPVVALSDPADLAGFIGTGLVHVAVDSVGQTTIDGPGNLLIRTALQAGAAVTVSYTYGPGGPQATPVPDAGLVAVGETRTVTAPLPALRVGVGGTALMAAAPDALTVAPRGVAEVLQGVALKGGTVSGTLRIDAGATATQTAIDVDAVATVDGVADRLSVHGLLVVDAGGQSTGSVLLELGSEIVAGRAAGSVIGFGGAQTVAAGGVSSTAMLSGGRAEIMAGGTGMTPTIEAFSVLTVDAGGMLETPRFGSPGGTLVLHQGAAVSGLGGFAAGDVIDLRDVAFTAGIGATLDSAGTVRLSGSGAPTLGFAEPGLAASDLHLSRDAAGTGTQITLDPLGLHTQGGQTVTSDYAGPVAGLQNQFAAITAATTVIAAAESDGWFLLGGAADDALAAHGGRNVLDGGAGSNFLVGGSGQDTFFVTVVPGAATWSTVAGALAGDDVTLWGLAPTTKLSWEDNQGAAGYTGLTLQAGSTRATLAGFTMQDLQAGRLTLAYGTAGDLPYAHIAINA